MTRTGRTESPICRLARFAAETSWDDIPEPTKDLARHQLASVVGSYATGFACGAARRVAEGLDVRPPDHGELLPRPAADRASYLGALCAASMAHDFDDYLYMGHTGHSAVGTVIADMIETDRLEGTAAGREAIVRIVIGNEIGGRIGASVFFGPHNGQLWTFIHLPIAAALHGRALGLDAERMAHALAIAFAQPPYPLAAAFMGAETKLLTAATPAMQGYRAAELARAGLRGNLDILGAPRGFFEEMSFVPLPQMISGLGKTWVTDTISFKRYPGCAYLGSILDALSEIRASHGLQASDVKSIDVEASFLTVEMDEMARPHREAREDLDPVLLNFSVADTVALDIVSGGMACGDLEPEALRMRAHEIRAMAARVHLCHSWDLSVDLLRSVNRAVPLGPLLGSLSLSEAREIRRQARRYHGKTLDVGFAALRRIASKLSASEKRALATFFGGRAIGRKKPPAFDLASVSFVAFELPVAARVTVETHGGARIPAGIRRPEGSPQTAGRLQVPRAKLLREAGRVAGPASAELLWRAIADLPGSWDALREALVPLAVGRA